MRAHTYISSYYIETISENPLKSKLVLIAQNDIKGFIPKFIVNKVVSKFPNAWVDNLIKGCEEVRRSSKNIVQLNS